MRSRPGIGPPSVYSWERAIGHYQTALELLEELEENPYQQAEVLEKLAQVIRLGKGKGALRYLEQALSLYEALGDRQKAGAVHFLLALQYSFEVGSRDFNQSYSHGSEAVALLETEGETSQLARAYVLLGSFSAVNGYPVSGGIALMEKGLSLAERLGDADRVMEASRHLGIILVVAGKAKRGLELLHKACEAAMKSDDAIAISHAGCELALAYARLWDPDGLLWSAEQAAEASGRSSAFRYQVHSALYLAWASALRGDGPRALSSVAMAQEVSRKAGVEVSQWSHPSTIAPGLASFYLGEWDTAEAGLLQCLETGRQAHQIAVPIFAAEALARLYLERGELFKAKAYLSEALTASQAREDRAFELVLYPLLAEAAVKSGETEEARGHLHRALEIVSDGEDWRGLPAGVRLAEGILAAVENRCPEAEAAFQQAVAINRQYHLPYYEARSLLEWGEMYLSRGASGDRKRAMPLLDQALAIFQRIQAKKMAEKVASLLEQTASLPDAAPTYPGGLTVREVEVLRLIAAGNIDREIGEKLFISIRTVGNHVSNILNKTNTVNRTEAATYAARHGLA